MLSFDKRFAKRPRQEAPDVTAAHLFMATDAIEPKGPSTSFGLESDAIDGLIGDAAGVIEISGVIKWFDMAKGFGFIVPDNGLDDVLLHVSCLRRDGFQTAYEGARITVEAHQRAKGLQAFRIVSMDESTAAHPAMLAAPRTHVTVTPTSGLERAIVKWFNRTRGFGFLTCGEGTPDIFVHMETLRRYGITELQPGQTVLVRFGPGPKGMMASEIHPDGGPHPFASH
jgi:CspA family cold shock protein